MRTLVLFALLLTGCGLVIGIERYRDCKDNECDASSMLPDAATDAPLADAPSESAPIDAGPACNPSADFGDPESLGKLNTNEDEVGGFVSEIDKDFYFARRNPMRANQTYGGMELYRAKMFPDGGFGPAIPVDGTNAGDAGDDIGPSVSPDGLRLYFYTYRLGPGLGNPFMTERTSLVAPWKTPTLLSVFDPDHHLHMYPIKDAIYSGSYKIHRAKVDSNGYIFTPQDIDPMGMAGINDPAWKNFAPVITPDELHLYFMSDRAGFYRFHIYEVHRTSKSAGWSMVKVLKDGINVPGTGPSDDQPCYITADNCTLYYASHPGSNADMFRVTRGM